MKRWLAMWLLSGVAWAHPLSWLTGTYHGSSEGSQLEEVWVEDGQEMLSTTTWLSDGSLALRELARVRPTASGYHLDLWITFPNGKSRHLEMEGGLESDHQLVFHQGSDTLSYRLGADGSLEVNLQKKELSTFRLSPGPSDPEKIVPQGDYILHTYIGERIFPDELHWTTATSGTLRVPDKFIAPLENVEALPQRAVVFDIMVPEGTVPYRVRYLMHFNADMSQATGILVHVGTGQTVGSFVALRKR